MHGVSAGQMSLLSGGDFKTGFISGAVASLVGSGIGSLGPEGAGYLNSGITQALMIVGGGLSGGISSSIAGGDFGQGMLQGLITSGLNHLAHMELEPNKTIAGIYGAGGEYASGNPDLKKLVISKGGRMFTSSVGGGDDEIIDYLQEGFLKGNKLEIYGHSRGAAAAVRIANKLGKMAINIYQIVLYDLVGMYLGGSFNFDYPNVMKVSNYYQRNPIDGILLWADNPFKGSPVSGSFQWPEINNVNLTGKYNNNGELMNHLNITKYAIQNP